MSTVAVDSRDAYLQPLRGWGRHVQQLVSHLPRQLIKEYRTSFGGPEVLWEQIGLPLCLRRDRVDALHVPNVFLPLLRSVPGIVTIHDLAFETFPDDFSSRTGAKYRYFAPRAARSAERVICVSQYTADDVVSRYGVPASRIRVIPNAPALPIGDQAVPDGGPYLLAVGDLRAKKNLSVLVSAWQALRAAGALDHRLVLAGLGSRDGLPAEVETPGYVSDGALDALLRGASVLVHPSLYEGFGLVVVEAMARGVPVACADATALPETAGGAAVLFDPRSPDAVAAAVLEALARSGELAAAGRARAASFSWAAVGATTADVYRELLP